MEIVLLAIVICLSNLLTFITGAKIGQKVAKQEPIEMPNLNPVKAVKNAIAEHKEFEKKQAEEEYYETIMHNVNIYDGTNAGQKRVPPIR